MINLTPHDIVVVTAEGEIVFPCSGHIARLTEEPGSAHAIVEDGMSIPVLEAPRYGGVTGIPEGLLAEHGARLPVRLLVSAFVGAYLAAHPETLPEGIAVYGPDTGPQGVLRDDKGQIVGSRRLLRYL